MRECTVFGTLKKVKSVVWHPKARDTVSSFPEPVRKEIGYLLFRLQNGDSFGAPHSSPMKTVSPGTNELRVRGSDGIYRVFYYTKSAEGILVFHAFVKKTPKTPHDEIDTAKRRLKELLED